MSFIICNLSFIGCIWNFGFEICFYWLLFWCFFDFVLNFEFWVLGMGLVLVLVLGDLWGADVLFLHSGQMPHSPAIPDSAPVSLLFLLRSHSDGMPYHSTPTTYPADVALSLRERRALSSEKAVCSPGRPRKSTPSSPCSICTIYMQSAYIPIHHLSYKKHLFILTNNYILSVYLRIYFIYAGISYPVKHLY